MSLASERSEGASDACVFFADVVALPILYSMADYSTSGFFQYPDTLAPRHIQIRAKVSGY